MHEGDERTRVGLDTLVDEAIRAVRAPLPTDIAELAKQAIFDSIICAIGGASSPEARAARGAFTAGGNAAVWGSSEQRDPVTAAFLNGIAAHALDYDDWAPRSGAHPSVTIVPALLAAAAESEVDGTALLSAYAAAYELQERIGLAIGPSHYALGFHTTGIIGTLGAACAAALVAAADRTQLRAALAFAATTAAGVKSVFGSAGKPLNAGNAASVGLRAALLAMADVVGPSVDAVFAPQGLAETHSNDVDLLAVAQPFGAPWHVRSLLFKFSSACFGTHGAIMAADSVRGSGVDSADLCALELILPPITRTVCTLPNPHTGQEAKFSVAFTVATALIEPVTTGSFADPFHPSDEVRRLMAATTLRFDPVYAKTQATLICTDDAGRITRTDADAGLPRWNLHPREQLSALRAKAHDLCDPIIGKEAVTHLADTVDALSRNCSSAELLRAVAGLTARVEAGSGR